MNNIVRWIFADFLCHKLMCDECKELTGNNECIMDVIKSGWNIPDNEKNITAEYFAADCLDKLLTMTEQDILSLLEKEQ